MVSVVSFWLFSYVHLEFWGIVRYRISSSSVAPTQFRRAFSEHVSRPIILQMPIPIHQCILLLILIICVVVLAILFRFKASVYPIWWYTQQLGLLLFETMISPPINLQYPAQAHHCIWRCIAIIFVCVLSILEHWKVSFHPFCCHSQQQACINWCFIETGNPITPTPSTDNARSTASPNPK